MKWHLEEKEKKSNKGEHNLFKGMFLLTGRLEVKSTLAKFMNHTTAKPNGFVKSYSTQEFWFGG